MSARTRSASTSWSNNSRCAEDNRLRCRSSPRTARSRTCIVVKWPSLTTVNTSGQVSAVRCPSTRISVKSVSLKSESASQGRMQRESDAEPHDLVPLQDYEPGPFPSVEGADLAGEDLDGVALGSGVVERQIEFVVGHGKAGQLQSPSQGYISRGWRR